MSHTDTHDADGRGRFVFLVHRRGPVFVALMAVSKQHACCGPGAGGRHAGLFQQKTMHELSIAMGLVDAACDELARLGPHVRIVALHVKVGAMSGVVPEALAFSFDVVAEGSAIAGARLEIEETPVTIHCVACGADQRLAVWPPLCCPRCGTPAADVQGGRELQLTALEVIDDAAHC